MFNWVFWLMLAFAITDWAGSWRGWGKARWVTKPGTLLLLITWFTQVGDWHGTLFWFGLGLIFSLAGDVLLQFPPGFFIAGMAAFFLAHLCYIVGLTRHPLIADWKIIVPILLLLLDSIFLTRRIRAGMREHAQTGMLFPVMSYAVILSLMLFFALSTLFRPGWGLTGAILVSIGAGLFYFSDIAIAYQRFVRPLPGQNLLVMTTYHTGQVLITIGALVQYTR